MSSPTPPPTFPPGDYKLADVKWTLVWKHGQLHVRGHLAGHPGVRVSTILPLQAILEDTQRKAAGQ